MLVSNETNQAGAPIHAPPVPQRWSELDTALKRSQDYLLSIQHSEGYWVGELMVDSTIVADTIAYRHWDGKVDSEWERKAVNHIF